MEQPLPTRPSSHAAPSFRLIERRPPRPGAILLALVAAAIGLYGVSAGLGHTRQARLMAESQSAARTTESTAAAQPGKQDDDKDDDPSQVDTIVLGDAADAPVRARKSDRVSPVHATILIHLPRYGQQTGLIPDSPSGHLLYNWLAAFNQSSYTELEKVLPNRESSYTVAAQLILRGQTGGFTLVSAREVQPGVLVFRLHDQTPDFNEVLGTLQVRPNSKPPDIASFSLRAVPVTGQKVNAGPSGAHER